MKLLPILFLPCLVAAGPRQEPDWKTYSVVVPALEKRGHAWMIQIDADTNIRPWAGVALAVHNSEILFAEFDEKTNGGSAHFYSPRGGRTIANSQFFLLQEDFMALHRRYLQDLDKYLDASGKAKEFKDGKDASACTPIMFEMDGQRFMPILDKPDDRTKRMSKKIIGTYFVDNDMVAYWNEKKKVRFNQNNVRSDFINPAAHPDRKDRMEFFCRTAHKY